MTENEITRTVAIEVEGKKVNIEVHIHLSQEEIEQIVTPVVLKDLSKQVRRGAMVDYLDQELGKRFREQSLPPSRLL